MSLQCISCLSYWITGCQINLYLMWLMISFSLSLPILLPYCNMFFVSLAFSFSQVTEESQHVILDQNKWYPACLWSHSILLGANLLITFTANKSTSECVFTENVHTWSKDAFTDLLISSKLLCICSLRPWSLGLDLISLDLGIFTQTSGQTETADYQWSLGTDRGTAEPEGPQKW